MNSLILVEAEDIFILNMSSGERNVREINSEVITDEFLVKNLELKFVVDFVKVSGTLVLLEIFNDVFPIIFLVVPFSLNSTKSLLLILLANL